MIKNTLDHHGTAESGHDDGTTIIAVTFINTTVRTVPVTYRTRVLLTVRR